MKRRSHERKGDWSLVRGENSRMERRIAVKMAKWERISAWTKAISASASVETQNSLLAKRYCLSMYLDDNAIVTAETLRHDVGLKGKFLQSAVVSTAITEQSMPVV